MAASTAAADPKRVASIMLGWHDLELVSSAKLQTLWAGYGQICAIEARATTNDAAAYLDKLCARENGAAGSTYPLVLKLISPPIKENAASDEGHLRKIFSYEVEQYFYTEVAPKLLDEVAVAKCLASTRDMSGRDGESELTGLRATLMTDLRPQFPVSGEKRSLLSEKQVSAALEWLARFHRRSWDDLPDATEDYMLQPLSEVVARRKFKEHPELARPRKLWVNGGYTYLSTRMSEYEDLRMDTESEWSGIFCTLWDSGKSTADLAASFLTARSRPFETYIHGDVKSENLFTTESGTQAAFFDFQYVGLGLGVCDLAKLFTCSVPLAMLVDDKNKSIPNELTMGDGEKRLLEQYRAILLDKDTRSYSWDDFKRHWETALVDWCRFQASWGFWGNTEWLQARVRSIHKDQAWRAWIKDSVSGD